MDKIKRILLLFFCILFLSGNSIQAEELPQVIFINHVRGNECCDTGNHDHFVSQLETFDKLNTPAFFAIRYDALIDPSYQSVIKKYLNNDLFQFGVMLEVTPNLAKQSFIEYKGNQDNWYQAQNAFLIGYSLEDRLTLIDSIVEAYKNIFKENPKFSTAWQVDTPSLNYLQKDYGLEMHQIAREQWGLDSYTLDGGPPHYPYLASKSWFFNPDFSDPNNLLIIRHTIDDSLYTYGDDTSSFTSQPNDFSIDNKDFGYFERLLDQVLNQSHQLGFANLGLENSMGEKFQKEYIKQIEKIAEFADQNRVEVVSDLKKIKSLYQDEKITIHQGDDLISGTDNKIYWITTPKYRLRIRFQGSRVTITDLRIYSPDLNDPYQTEQAINKGYLISPYLINDGIDFPEVKTASKVQQFLKIPMINSFTAQPKKDVLSQNNYLELPDNIDFEEISIPSKNTISYPSKSGLITFSFNQDTFEIKGINNKDIEFTQNKFELNPIKIAENKDGEELSWLINDQASHKAFWSCESDSCLFEFELNSLLFKQIRETQYPFIFPEKKPRQIDREKTITYVHNRYAIAKRNPVRIVLVPQDMHGFPTSSRQAVKVKVEPEISQIIVENQNDSREYQFIDLSNDQPEKVLVKLQLDEYQLQDQIIYFAPNCKNQLLYCLTHPQQAWWFVRTIFEDKLRLKLLGEKQS
ncbi:MAG: hypothetical protein GW942_01200 [Candidatus Pacebacteria bacterium]|nr:hypothetical protein [Candidatus Paceibacterota bacterium]